jgi:hypothetical protein
MRGGGGCIQPKAEELDGIGRIKASVLFAADFDGLFNAINEDLQQARISLRVKPGGQQLGLRNSVKAFVLSGDFYSRLRG